MDWKEKIEQGMQLIIEGCKENLSWRDCRECPFDEYCTAIYSNENFTFETPDEWV